MALVTDDHLYRALVFIFDAQKRAIQGVGFLTHRSGLIVTCSHVLFSSISQVKDRRDKPPVADMFFQFYQDRYELGDKAPVRRADILGDWLPYTKGDVIIGQYKGVYPKGVTSLPLGKPDMIGSVTQTNYFRTVGFSNWGGFETVVAEGTILSSQNRTKNGFDVILLDDKSRTIVKGFSGAPVLNINSGHVIGMISWIIKPTLVERKQESLVAAIRSDLIRSILPVDYPLKAAIEGLAPKTKFIAGYTKIDADSIFGRNNEASQLMTLCQVSDSMICVRGEGGLGKTTFLQLFATSLGFEKRYDNVVWIDFQLDIPTSFISNQSLLNSLGLSELRTKASRGQISVETAFEKIIYAMCRLGGKNILIIDGVDRSLLKFRPQLSLDQNWSVVVSSRNKLPGFKDFPLSTLEGLDAVSTFSFYANEDLEKQREAVIALTDTLFGNPLAIEIWAKVYKNNRNLTITGLQEVLNQKGLSGFSGQSVETLYDKVEIDTYIRDCLVAAFEVTGLSKQELSMLASFCLLPPRRTPYHTLEKFFGSESDSSIGGFNDLLTNLILKGWIKEYEEELVEERRLRNKFLCHPLIQDAIINIMQANDFPTLSVVKTLSEEFLNYPGRAIDTLQYEGFPEHIHGRFSLQDLQLDFFVMISRYVHFFNYIGKKKEASEWAQRWFNANIPLPEGTDTNNVIKYAKICINIHSTISNDMQAIAILQNAIEVLCQVPLQLRSEGFYIELLKAYYDLTNKFIELKQYAEAQSVLDESSKVEIGQSEAFRTEYLFLLITKRLLAIKTRDFKTADYLTDQIWSQQAYQSTRLFYPTEEVDFILQDAEIKFEVNRLGEIPSIVSKALNISQSYDPFLFMEASRRSAKLLARLGHLSEATKILGESIKKGEASTKGRPPYVLISSYLEVAYVYSCMKESALTAEYLSKYEHYENTMKVGRSTEEVIRRLLQKAEVLRFCARYRDAEHVVDRCFNYLSDLSDAERPLFELKSVNSEALNMLGSHKQERQIFDSTEILSKLERAHNLYTNSDPALQGFIEAPILDTFGQLYAYKGDKKTALEYYERSLKIYKELFSVVNPHHYEIINVERNMLNQLGPNQ